MTSERLLLALRAAVAPFALPLYYIGAALDHAVNHIPVRSTR